jgi:hypothetical protein
MASATDMAKIVKERDDLKAMDKERRKMMVEQRVALDTQLQELEEKLWNAVQDKRAEEKRRQEIEISQQAAVNELLRLRASSALPPGLENSLAAAGDEGEKLRATGVSLVAAVDSAVSEQDLKAAYRRAEADVHRKMRRELEAIVNELRVSRQDLVLTQGSLADEVATDFAWQTEREAEREAALAAAAEAAAGGTRAELEAAMQSKEALVFNLQEQVKKQRMSMEEMRIQVATLSSELEGARAASSAKEAECEEMRVETNHVREQMGALQMKHDAATKDKGSLQAQLLGTSQDKTKLEQEMTALNNELGLLGAEKQALEARLQELETQSTQRAGDGDVEKELGRLALVAVPHACFCLERALEQLTEKQGSASTLASLSLALLALQDIAGPARRAVDSSAQANMKTLVREALPALANPPPSSLKESVYAVALASTLSAGRRELVPVAGIAGTLARICAQAQGACV